jgi:hypothetical protein
VRFHVFKNVCAHEVTKAAQLSKCTLNKYKRPGAHASRMSSFASRERLSKPNLRSSKQPASVALDCLGWSTRPECCCRRPRREHLLHQQAHTRLLAQANPCPAPEAQDSTRDECSTQGSQCTYYNPVQQCMSSAGCERQHARRVRSGFLFI